MGENKKIINLLERIPFCGILFFCWSEIDLLFLFWNFRNIKFRKFKISFFN